MAVDIWPVWACEQGTADIITVAYSDDDEDSFENDLFAADEMDTDRVVLIKTKQLIALKKKWKKDKQIVKVIDFWLKTMEEKDMELIRLVINQ